MKESRETMIGLSQRTHNKLKQLKENGLFLEMSDAYRAGVALAISKGLSPSKISEKRTTIFSVATIDPKREMANTVTSLIGPFEEPIYSIIEQLAELGIIELYNEYIEQGTINITDLLKNSHKNK